MRELVTVKIYNPGEPDVGIFSAEWEITGGFFVEDDEEREEIRGALETAFSIITGDTNNIVIFSDED